MPGPQGYPRYDPYAAVRCACGHLIYADDVIGEDCRFCPCTSHRPHRPDGAA